MVIKNARVLVGGKILKDRDVAVEGGRITAVGEGLEGGREIDARGALLAPGFVDLHIHGCAGDDTMDGGDAVKRMARWLPRTGVTALLPTTMCSIESHMVVGRNAVTPVRGSHWAMRFTASPPSIASSPAQPWMCRSTNPGASSAQRASISTPPVRPSPTAMMRPPSTRTS
jgi:hypothetical protein